MTRLLPLLLICWTGLLQAASPPATRPVTTGPWQPRLSAFGQVSAAQQARLSLPFSVRITALPVEPGTLVSSGDTLARFEAPLLEQHLTTWQQYRQQRTLAEQQYRLLVASEKEHAATRLQLVAGEQALAAAETKTLLAWQTLAADLGQLNNPVTAQALGRRLDKQGTSALVPELGMLKAPFTGMISRRLATVGEQLLPDQPLLELDNLERVFIDVAVPEAELKDWLHGSTRWLSAQDTIKLQAVPGQPRYNAASGLWLLRFTADNPDRLLQDGAWIELQHRGETRSVVWVPESAVVSRHGKTWCLLADGKTFKPVEVQAAAPENGQVPIIAGLQSNDRVVTEDAYEWLYRDLKDLIKFVD